MNTTIKFALSTAAVFVLSGAAFADEVVQLGFAGTQGSPVSFVRRTPETNSVAVYQNGAAIGRSARHERKHSKFVSRPAGYYGNDSTSYYTGGR
jgi:hypothetical protein